MLYLCLGEISDGLSRPHASHVIVVVRWCTDAAILLAVTQAFDYTCDEPGAFPARYTMCLERARALHEADPQLKVMITAEKTAADATVKLFSYCAFIGPQMLFNDLIGFCACDDATVVYSGRSQGEYQRHDRCVDPHYQFHAILPGHLSSLSPLGEWKRTPHLRRTGGGGQAIVVVPELHV